MEARALIDPVRARISPIRDPKGIIIRITKVKPHSVLYVKQLVRQHGFTKIITPRIA